MFMPCRSNRDLYTMDARTLLVLLAFLHASVADAEDKRLNEHLGQLYDNLTEIRAELFKEENLKRRARLLNIDSKLEEVNRAINSISSSQHQENQRSESENLRSLHQEALDNAVTRQNKKMDQFEEEQKIFTEEINGKLQKLSNIITSVYDSNKKQQSSFDTSDLQSLERSGNGLNLVEFVLENVKELERKVQVGLDNLREDIRHHLNSARSLSDSPPCKCPTATTARSQRPQDPNLNRQQGMEISITNLEVTLALAEEDIKKEIRTNLENIYGQLSEISNNTHTCQKSNERTIEASSEPSVVFEEFTVTSAEQTRRLPTPSPKPSIGPFRPSIDSLRSTESSVLQSMPPTIVPRPSTTITPLTMVPRPSTTSRPSTISSRSSTISPRPSSFQSRPLISAPTPSVLRATEKPCLKNSFYRNSKNCWELYGRGVNCDGVYAISVYTWIGPRNVYCDMQDGGWTVFFRRSGQVNGQNFTQSWESYKNGFGDVGGEHWQGNEFLYRASRLSRLELKIDIVSRNGSVVSATFPRFHVGSESTGYELRLGLPTGPTWYLASNLNYSNRAQFSTYDRSYRPCNRMERGGWWYTCNPSPVQLTEPNMYWYNWNSDILHVTMKIRPWGRYLAHLKPGGRSKPPWTLKSGKLSLEATNLVWADSPFNTDQLPVRLGLLSQTTAELSAKIQLPIEKSIEMQESASNANLPTGERYAKSAASHEFAATMPSSGALPSRQNWAEISEDQGPDSGDDYTVVQNKRRRRDTAAPRVTTAQSNSAGPAARRQRSSPAFIPRVQEIRTTRTHIAEARARQATCTEEQNFFLEYCPDYEPYHYLKAIGGLVGGTKNIIQFSKVNGQYLVGLTSRSLAEQLIREGLEVEGTLLRTFPFRRTSTRITIGNLPFFVRDAVVIDALARYGRVTSIAPKQLKGEAWPAYLTYGIKCSRCQGQGHKRANCPLLHGRPTTSRRASPPPSTSLPPSTAPGLPRRTSAAPPAPAPPSPAKEVCGAPPVARDVPCPSAPRPSPSAPPALPMEEAPPAPPPVTPAPSLRAPGGSVSPQSAKSQPSAQDIEMTAIEESSTSSTSSSRKSTREDLVAFIRKSPAVSFAETDALGLGREEVLDLLSSKTKAQRQGPLLTPPQSEALAGIIKQLLGLKPRGNTNVYKILHQVKSELKTGPAAVPQTPTLTAPRPAETTPPAPHGEKPSPDIATPPPPLSCQFIDDRWIETDDILHKLNQERDWELGIEEGDIIDAIIYPEDREPLIKRLSTRRRSLLAAFISAAIERARDSDPFVREGMSALRRMLPS
ncbi:ANGPT4 [Cordylochernes scorpioides]|uniref:ANGPT4 n=1 Tax=Cordylochernes scorpioides TaxID=51811 RepID=A0ABY6JZM8_9ARAC|nr:ANGPT4 [Cordylochernes scorpioides]